MERDILRRKRGSAIRESLRCAGAFSAWMAGSGFATGRELVQFFARHGQNGYLGAVVLLLGFFLTAPAVLAVGHEHRDEENFDHFTWFCGPVLGGLYRILSPAAAMLLTPVLLSGAGAVARENWGTDTAAGSAAMAALVLAACAVGFRRFTALAAVTTPAALLFSLMVAGGTVLCAGAQQMAAAQPGWLGSAVLYLSMNIWGGSTYHCRLGAGMGSRRAARAGACLGAAGVTGAAALMTAALLIVPGAREAEIPALYLAAGIAPGLARVFTVVLLMSIFSSCCAMLWTACPASMGMGPRAAVLTGALLLGRLPFAWLVERLYPLLGWAGMPFVVCTAFYTLAGRRICRE